MLIRDDSDLVVARRHVRTLGRATALSAAAVERLATAVTEIARNIVVHAGHGHLSFRTVRKAGKSGIAVVAQDGGPGIPDVDRAMNDGYSSGRGLGLGLPSAKRLVDEFAIESVVEGGTKVTLCQWSAPRGHEARMRER